MILWGDERLPIAWMHVLSDWMGGKQRLKRLKAKDQFGELNSKSQGFQRLNFHAVGVQFFWVI